MKIAVLAHIRHAIAEPFMGGMEAHCRMLCDGLRAAGHDVTLFAAAGSHDENLAAICPAPYEQVLPWKVWRGSARLATYQREAFERAWQRIIASGYDVVHNNSLFPDVIDWAARDAMPCVTSQHVPPFGAMREGVERNAFAPHLKTTTASTSQLALWGERFRTNMMVVRNGVNCDQWAPRGEPAEHFVWAGRVTPTKGTAEAAQAARKAGLRLQIFGPVEDARYFEEEVVPHLADGVEFRGHQRAERLRPVVASARGALVTPLWDEPFGLVAAEALACGTPVCAFDNGALGEVVGDCGFVVAPGDVDALADAMRMIGEIDRHACRARALTRFSVETMIEGYEACYRDAVDALLDQAAAAFSSSHSSTTELLA